MQKTVLFLVGLFLLVACGSSKPKPLTSVNTTPVLIESSLPKEQVWDKLVDFLASSGTSIKIIDKSSGLVTTDDYSFGNSWTWEDKKGNIKNPNAYVVIKKMKGAPNVISGQWNVRIKDNPQGGTLINVNLVNLRAYNTQTYKNYTIGSSQVFEKDLAKAIK